MKKIETIAFKIVVSIFVVLSILYFGLIFELIINNSK